MKALYINENTRITRFDEKNLQIETLKSVKKKNGEIVEQWLGNGFYGSLETALTGVLKKELLSAPEECETLREVIQKIEDSKTEIINAVKK